MMERCRVKFYRRLIVVLIGLTCLFCPVLSYAASPYPDMSSVLGTLPVNEAQAIFYNKSSPSYQINRVDGTDMSASGYYAPYEFWIPCGSYYSEAPRDGVLYFYDVSENGFSVSPGFVYVFDIVVDYWVGTAELVDLDSLRFGVGSPAGSDLNISNLTSVADFYDQAFVDLKPQKVEHVVDTFYRLTYALPVYPEYFQKFSLTDFGVYRLFGFCLWDPSSTYFLHYLSENMRVRCYVMNMSVKRYSSEEYQILAMQQGFDNMDQEVLDGLRQYDEELSSQYDFSEGQESLNKYQDAESEVAGMVDTEAINSAFDISDLVGSWSNGISAAGEFIDFLYSEVITFNQVIPVAVCFSAVALLLGLARNK